MQDALDLTRAEVGGRDLDGRLVAEQGMRVGEPQLGLLGVAERLLSKRGDAGETLGPFAGGGEIGGGCAFSQVASETTRAATRRRSSALSGAAWAATCANQRARQAARHGGDELIDGEDACAEGARAAERGGDFGVARGYIGIGPVSA